MDKIVLSLQELVWTDSGVYRSSAREDTHKRYLESVLISDSTLRFGVSFNVSLDAWICILTMLARHTVDSTRCSSPSSILQRVAIQNIPQINRSHEDMQIGEFTQL